MGVKMPVGRIEESQQVGNDGRIAEISERLDGSRGDSRIFVVKCLDDNRQGRAFSKLSEHLDGRSLDIRFRPGSAVYESGKNLFSTDVAKCVNGRHPRCGISLFQRIEHLVELFDTLELLDRSCSGIAYISLGIMKKLRETLDSLSEIPVNHDFVLADIFVFNNERYAGIIRRLFILQEMLYMKDNLKPALLSALVLPGLGQLKKGHRVKGGIILFLVNLFIIVALATVGGAVAKIFVASQGTPAGAMSLLGEVQKSSPAGRWVLFSFLFLWFYSVTDALVSPACQNRTTGD